MEPSSPQFSPQQLLPQIKNLCKGNADAPVICATLLLNEYFSRNTVLDRSQLHRAMEVTHELFMRSAKFREEIVKHLHTLLISSTLQDKTPDHELVSYMIDTILQWHEKFASKYPQLWFTIQCHAELNKAYRDKVQERTIQITVENHRLEELLNGFGMYDDELVVANVVGKQVYDVLIEAQEQLETIDQCLGLLLSSESLEEEMEWEDVQVVNYFPSDYQLKVTLPEVMASPAVLETLRGAKRVLERRVLPPMRGWAEILEERCQDNTKTMEVLLRVKTWLKNVVEAVGQCERALHS